MIIDDDYFLAIDKLGFMMLDFFLDIDISSIGDFIDENLDIITGVSRAYLLTWILFAATLVLAIVLFLWLLSNDGMSFFGL